MEFLWLYLSRDVLWTLGRWRGWALPGHVTLCWEGWSFKASAVLHGQGIATSLEDTVPGEGVGHLWWRTAWQDMGCEGGPSSCVRAPRPLCQSQGPRAPGGRGDIS